MKKMFLVSLILVILIGLAVGGLIYLKTEFKMPSVSIKSVSCELVSGETFCLTGLLEIDNLMQTSIGCTSIKYKVLANKNEIAVGEVSIKEKIGAKNKTTVKIPVSLDLKDIKALQKSEIISLEMAGDVFFDLKIKECQVPFVIKREIPRKKEKPKWEIVAVNISLGENKKIDINVKISLINPSPLEIALSKVDYQVLLGEKKVAAGFLEKRQEIKSKEPSLVECPIVINMADFKKARKNGREHH